MRHKNIFFTLLACSAVVVAPNVFAQQQPQIEEVIIEEAIIKPYSQGVQHIDEMIEKQKERIQKDLQNNAISQEDANKMLDQLDTIQKGEQKFMDQHKGGITKDEEKNLESQLHGLSKELDKVEKK